MQAQMRLYWDCWAKLSGDYIIWS